MSEFYICARNQFSFYYFLTFTIFEILNFANSRNGENLNFTQIGVAKISIIFEIDL